MEASLYRPAQISAKRVAVAAALILGGCQQTEVLGPVRTADADAIPTAAPARLGPDYVAGFNEPFYSFTSEDTGLLVKSPDQPEGTMVAATRTPIDGGTRFEGMLDAKPFTLEITAGACRDDMSGLAFSHDARLIFGNAKPQTGCARLTSEPMPRETGR